MVDQAKLDTLKTLLAACQYGRLSQDGEMPECVTHFTRRGVENLLTSNVEGYFAFKNEQYAALLVFVANELPGILDRAYMPALDVETVIERVKNEKRSATKCTLIATADICRLAAEVERLRTDYNLLIALSNQQRDVLKQQDAEIARLKEAHNGTAST